MIGLHFFQPVFISWMKPMQRRGKGPGLWHWIPALPLTSQVTSSVFHPLSKPQFLHLYSGDNNANSYRFIMNLAWAKEYEMNVSSSPVTHVLPQSMLVSSSTISPHRVSGCWQFSAWYMYQGKVKQKRHGFRTTPLLPLRQLFTYGFV